MPLPCRRAFTTIEMLAVLVVAALLAGTASLSLKGMARSADVATAVDQLVYADRIIRARARLTSRPTRLLIDPSRGAVRAAPAGEEGNTPGEGGGGVLAGLPEGVAIERVLVRDRAAEGLSGPASVPFSAGGLSPSYAVLVARDGGGAGRRRWVVFAGLTGQATRAEDDRAVEALFDGAGGEAAGE